MELAIKKINRAVENFIDKGNYQYAPSKYVFDYVSDKDYVYMIVEMHYIIRVPRKDVPQILSASASPMIKTDFQAEQQILGLIDNTKQVDYTLENVVDENGLKLAIFIDDAGHEIVVNAKFFKQFYNSNIIDKGVPENVLFTGDGTAKSWKYPLLMWENDEVVGVFCPVKRIKNSYQEKSC